MTRTMLERGWLLSPALSLLRRRPHPAMPHGSASIPRRRVAAVLVAALVLGVAPASLAQVPTPIPPDVANQILNLMQRVTALEQKLATMTNGSSTLRVRAPFEVIDAGGRPILQVVEASGKASASPGILISASSTSGHAALSLLNKSGSPVVEIANLPEEEGIALYDHSGRLRAGFGLDGVIETWDESKNAVLFVGPDAKKGEAAIRLGKDEDGYALQVGFGADAARLGEDAEGFGLLTLSDEKENTRASIAGDGTLRLWDASNQGLLTVADDVSEDDAAVTIGRGTGGTRIKVGSTRAIMMGANSTIAAVGAFEGSSPTAMLSLTDLGGRLTLYNESAKEAVSLHVGEGGQGKFHLGNADGSVVVEAGLSVDGVGVVNAYPHGLPGSYIKGQAKKK